MCNPKMINIELRASFGIKILKPFNAAIETAIIGPIIQAKGILKKSARRALGIEIMMTSRNFLEKSFLIFSRLNGIACCMYSINGC